MKIIHISFANEKQLPILPSPCPEDGETTRDFINQTKNKYTYFDDKIFNAIKKHSLDNW